MAGAGVRLFTAGQILTASQVNTYLMDQVISVFPDSASRDAAFGGLGEPALSEGRVCYLQSDDKIYLYNGTSWSELALSVTGTAGQVVVYNGSGAPTATTITGDISVNSSGVASIASGSIVNADVNASAAIDKTKISGTAITAADTGTVTSTMILDGTILNADINASAAIADTKLATIATAGKVSNSATTATSANTASAIVARDASGNFTAGKATLATADINTVVETASIVASAATGVVNIDFSTNPTVYYTTSATANWTLNVRGTSLVTLNSTLATGQIATITFMATIGASQFRPTVFQVDGASVTPKWQGGVAPVSGNANSIDMYTLAVLKTGNAAFTVFASQTRFA